ncbi:MAG TPA: hypothetical protein VH475_04135 [Tepidisphaeraceae bacterium]|jgi:hypothetical protein
MAKVNLFPDFRELLGSLNSAGVKYLVLGGYAVNHYGYHRATALDFDASYERRNIVEWDGIQVPLISFEDLRSNKQGSGRAKDLADLENLPVTWPPPVSGAARKGKRTRRKRG